MDPISAFGKWIFENPILCFLIIILVVAIPKR